MSAGCDQNDHNEGTVSLCAVEMNDSYIVHYLQDQHMHTDEQWVCVEKEDEDIMTW